MDRRKTIKFLTLFPILPIPAMAEQVYRHFYTSRSASFIDPITATTIGISIVKTFSGLFSSSGDSTNAYMIEYLKKLEEMLGVINDKIGYLIKNMEQVKQLLHELPTEVVTLLKQNEMNGRIADYRGLLSELQLKPFYGNPQKYVNYIVRGKRENLKKVDSLVDQIRIAKSNLRALENPYMVPYIAMAVQIQYNLQNNFLKQPWLVFYGDIENDYLWLHKQVFTAESSVEKTLEKLKTARQEIINRNKTWIAKVWRRDDECGLCVHLFVYSHQLLQKPATDILDEADLQYLQRVGLLTEEEKPIVFEEGPQQKPVDVLTVQNTNEQIIHFTANPNGNFEQQIAEVTKKRQEVLAELNDELKMNYYSLVAIASSYYAGLKAIEYCRIYMEAAKYTK